MQNDINTRLTLPTGTGREFIVPMAYVCHIIYNVHKLCITINEVTPRGLPCTCDYIFDTLDAYDASQNILLDYMIINSQ